MNWAHGESINRLHGVFALGVGLERIVHRVSDPRGDLYTKDVSGMTVTQRLGIHRKIYEAAATAQEAGDRPLFGGLRHSLAVTAREYLWAEKPAEHPIVEL